MRIGELSRRAEVTVRTVRFYESLGLLPRGRREGTGQHRYPDEAVLRLRKIEQLKALGLSLGEVGSVIDLYFTETDTRGAKQQVLILLRRHLAEAERRMEGLERFRIELAENIARFEQWLGREEQRAEDVGHE